MYLISNRFSNRFLVAVLASIAFMGVPSQGRAAFYVTLKSGAASAVVYDENTSPGTYSDTFANNPFVTKIEFNTGAVAFAGYYVDVDSRTTAPGAGGEGKVTSNTLTIRATAAATSPIEISVYSDGFDLGLPLGTYPLLVTNSVASSDLTGGTATAETIINELSTPLSGPSASINPSVDSDESVFITPGVSTPFSITSKLTISGMGAGDSGNVTWTSQVQALPAPGALMLLCTGLPALGAGMWLRRRKLPSKA